jgi:hypothetical protein
VSFLTIRDMLSEFKKDIISCLESYLVGWASSNAVVNRATKGNLKEKKLGFEKPKPQVKQNLFQKEKCEAHYPLAEEAPRPWTLCWHCSVHRSPSFSDLQSRNLEKGESSRAGLEMVSPVSAPDTTATGDNTFSDTPATSEILSSPDTSLQDRSLLAIVSGSVSACSDAMLELSVSGLSSPDRFFVSGSSPAVTAGSVSLENGAKFSERCSEVPAPSLPPSPDLEDAPVSCQNHTRV